ncbi:MAG TPA: Glu-tRNA(Gln) amidotransferase subunit GatD [Thermoplasmata archaeon]|nr:Glu-tRNA(Gln) amidotransferase subunit GatD [Thermoplasmata archaeon]
MAERSGSDPWEALRTLPMGQRVEIVDGKGRRWVGTVVSRHELSGDRILPLKLESGYNVGVRIEKDVTFRLLERPRVSPLSGTLPTSVSPEMSAGAPVVTLLTTGGTIASRVDYETGGVKPVKEEREILSFYPELERAGRVRIVPVFDRLSEDLTPHDWEVLAERVVESFRAGSTGVVIAHGTDVMGYTAAALSFLLIDLPGPVVLVGAQRSPDRPSSDGASNLGAAVEVAHDRRFGEVVVVMHSGLSDSRFAIHRGTWVRKMHSSRRDAFESRNGPTLGYVENREVHFDVPPRPPASGPARVEGPLEPRTGLLWFYPGMPPEKAAAYAEGLRGLVLAGTGLGHTASVHTGWIRASVERGTVVAMTTQCLAGNADPFIYSTGRELARAGVVYVEDLLPETAYAKMAWALGRSSDPTTVVRLLQTDRAGEFLRRHIVEGAR